MSPECQNCEALVELKKEIAALRNKISSLEADIAKSRKNSSNSSKPPSSDIIKPPKPLLPDGKKREAGGQPGHERHERTPFAADEIDRIIPHFPRVCPHCGSDRIKPGEFVKKKQRVDLPEKPIIIEEHHAHSGRCVGCGREVKAEFPAEIENGSLFSPRMAAHAAFLKGAGHMSYTGIADYLKNVFHIPVSRGHIVNEMKNVGDALDAPYDEMLSRLPEEKNLNIDETSHRENGKLPWTWVFRSDLFALYRICDSRGAKVLHDTLGKGYDGIIGCDYYGAYRKFNDESNARIQFCMAHLSRDVKFLEEHPDRVTANYGGRVAKRLRRLFRVKHKHGEMTAEKYASAIRSAGDELAAAAIKAPVRGEARNMANRFREYKEEYLRFVTTPGLEPTNNAAERALRFVVIDRKVTQGTRGEWGRRFCERIWSVVGTCRMRGQSIFEYLVNAVKSHYNGLPIPSLINST